MDTTDTMSQEKQAIAAIKPFHLAISHVLLV